MFYTLKRLLLVERDCWTLQSCALRTAGWPLTKKTCFSVWLRDTCTIIWARVSPNWSRVVLAWCWVTMGAFITVWAWGQTGLGWLVRAHFIKETNAVICFTVWSGQVCTACQGRTSITTCYIWSFFSCNFLLQILTSFTQVIHPLFHPFIFFFLFLLTVLLIGKKKPSADNVKYNDSIALLDVSCGCKALRAFRRDHNVCVILKTAYQSIHTAGNKGEVRRAIFSMKHYFYNERPDSLCFFFPFWSARSHDAMKFIIGSIFFYS